MQTPETNWWTWLIGSLSTIALLTGGAVKFILTRKTAKRIDAVTEITNLLKTYKEENAGLKTDNHALELENKMLKAEYRALENHNEVGNLILRNLLEITPEIKKATSEKARVKVQLEIEGIIKEARNTLKGDIHETK